MPLALAALASRLGLPKAAGFAAKHWRPLVLLGLLGALMLALLFARADAQHWRKVADKRADTIKENADAYARAQRDAEIKAAPAVRGQRHEPDYGHRAYGRAHRARKWHSGQDRRRKSPHREAIVFSPKRQ